MKTVKAFMVGIFLPTLLMPFFLLLFDELGAGVVITLIFIHFVPFIWGIWNVLDLWVCHYFLPKDKIVSSLIVGGSLGLLVALIGVFGIGVPEMVGLKGGWQYFPLVVAPIVYAILWLVIVTPLNYALDVKS